MKDKTSCHEQSKERQVELPQLGRGRPGQLHAQLERDAQARWARCEDPLCGQGRCLRPRRDRDLQRGPEKRGLLHGGCQRRRGRTTARGGNRRADPHPEPFDGPRDRGDHQVQPHAFRFRSRLCPGASEKTEKSTDEDAYPHRGGHGHGPRRHDPQRGFPDDRGDPRFSEPRHRGYLHTPFLKRDRRGRLQRETVAPLPSPSEEARRKPDLHSRQAPGQQRRPAELRSISPGHGPPRHHVLSGFIPRRSSRRKQIFCP